MATVNAGLATATAAALNPGAPSTANAGTALAVAAAWPALLPSRASATASALDAGTSVRSGSGSGSGGGGGGAQVAAGFPYHQLGVKVELLLNTTWTDITRYVLVRDNISISPFGRSDETTQMDTSSLTMTLQNKDGRFTPDNTGGAYAPYVQLNTRLRLSVKDNSVTGTGYSGYRFWGEVCEWDPQWDPSGRDSSVKITVSGIWRRISQANENSTIGSPYTRYNKLTVMANDTVAAYWPMEDGATQFASPTTSPPPSQFVSVTPSTAANMQIVTGSPTFASAGNFRGSDAIPALSQAELSGLISTNSNPSDILFRFLLFPPTNGETAAAGPIARIHLTGTLSHVDVVLHGGANGPTEIQGFNSANTMVFDGTTNVRMWGQPLLVQVGLTQNGSNIAWSLNMVEQGGTNYYSTPTGQIAGTVDDATSVIFNPGANFSETCVGQAIVIYGNPAIGNAVPALGGYQQEDATTRFTRICAEQGIATETIGGLSGTPMGIQSDDTLANLLQEIENTDGGLLYETRDQFGLGYRTQASLQNQSPALVLNYNAQQVGQPLQPYTDDALVRNDITLNNNFDGYSVEAYLANGPRSIQSPPNGVGAGYQYSLTVNSTSHTQINNRAIQMLNCGTVAVSRCPAITVNLARITTAPLFSAVPSMRVGDYLQITNMPPQGGASTSKQLAWGWTETLNYNVWTIEFNTIPELPWESSFNPGGSVAQQVPSFPVTQNNSTGGSVVAGVQIAEGAIVGANLAAGTITGGNLAAGTITATNIATATITGNLIASGSITGDNVTAASITGTSITSGSITGTNIGSGTISGSNIASAYNLGSNIASATITGGASGNIANGTIVGSNIGSATITAGNITNATITNVQIAAGSITGGSGGNLGSATITGANIANATVTSVQISNGTITTTQISNSANITGTQIANGTITAANIVANTITGTQIAASTITGSLIAANTIAAGNIVANTITAAQIAASTITTTQISASAGITGGQIAAHTITAGNITANTITATEIASGTITGTQIAASVSLTSPSITGGTVTGASLVADGSSGEFLVYSGTPASGNLIGSISATSGTDGFSNSYSAGTWAYGGSGNNSIGLVASGANTALALNPGSTPASITGTTLLFGASSGTAQLVDGQDGKTYGIARRTLVNQGTGSLSTTMSTVFTTQLSNSSGASGDRLYRFDAMVGVNIAAGASQQLTFELNGPGAMTTASEAILILRSTSVFGIGWSNSVGINGGPFPTSAALGLPSASTYMVQWSGVIHIPAGTGGPVNWQMAVSTGTAGIAADTWIDIMPV